MAIDPWIARGGAPVDITNTLAQIAALRQRDQAIAADENRNKLYQRRLDQEDQVRSDERASAEEQKQAEHLLAKTEWALRSGNPRQAILSDPGIDPRAAQAFSQMDDRQLTEMLQQKRAEYASKLGIGPPEEKQPSGAMYKTVGPNGQPYYAAADGQPRFPAYQEPEQPRAAREPPRPQLVDVLLPDGTVQKQWVVAGESTGTPIGAPTAAPQNQPKPPTETDKKVGVLYGSMVGAEADIAAMKGKTDTSSRYNATMGAVPIIGDATATFQTGDFRKYESAALRWSANLLYIKSGATAPPEEVRSTYRQFFPQPGDDEATKQQKAAARAQEMANVRSQYPEVTAKVPTPAPADGATLAKPKPGDNVKGYIFIGGDPSQKSNWVKSRE
jgi:hypothetical protein